ncbi:uncharacterized protein PFL1_04549 [Pseudozyma flocculosa PF-1]|uniref:DUF1772-domain-containing protein n=2 Tax=Pseudozyma flocculosa TaxID=84751 RepID=A0A5C3F9E7_9BASI|nr:uncharacterized protein PFL1_04549 [Pseudozyma flocculosa PF-1]EPQ27804.1 hypothetical protein PFL1_04549 [Pseudozyma flocculosa PF-1]SPO41068.1 uncharacterized protein PSFLO_06550 [Pseudozyma flocculosa]
MTFATVVGLGLGMSGISVGLMLSYPLIYNQTFLRSDTVSALSKHHRLDVWSRGYEGGKAANAPATALTALAFFSTWAYRGRYVVANRKINLYVVAGVFSALVVPFTVLAIKPVNDRLYAHLANAKSTASAADDDEVEALFAKWTRLHNVRVALSLVSMAVGFYATFGF